MSLQFSNYMLWNFIMCLWNQHSFHKEPVIWRQGDFGFHLNGGYFVNFEAIGS